MFQTNQRTSKKLMSFRVIPKLSSHAVGWSALLLSTCLASVTADHGMFVSTATGTCLKDRSRQKDQNNWLYPRYSTMAGWKNRIYMEVKMWKSSPNGGFSIAMFGYRRVGDVGPCQHINDWLVPMKPIGGNHNDNLCGWCFTSWCIGDPYLEGWVNWIQLRHIEAT